MAQAPLRHSINMYHITTSQYKSWSAIIFMLLFCSLVAMEGEQIAVKLQETSLAQLIAAWHKEKDIKSAASIIIKYLDGSPEEGLNESFQDAFRWCRLALAEKSFADDGIRIFKENGIYDSIKKLADEGNPHACYVMGGLLYVQVSQDKAITLAPVIKYLQKARHAEPLAYPALLSLISPVDALTLSNEIQQRLETFQLPLREHLIKEMKARCEALWAQNKQPVLEQLLTWYIAAGEPRWAFERVFTQIAERNLLQEFSQTRKEVHDFLKKLTQQDALCAYQIGMLYLNAVSTGKDQSQTNRERALGCLRAGQKKNHLPSTWMLIACDPASGYEQFNAALELTRLSAEKKALSALDKAAAARGIESYAERAQTFEELQALGDLYSTGIPTVIDCKPAEAVAFYKAAYENALAKDHHKEKRPEDVKKRSNSSTAKDNSAKEKSNTTSRARFIKNTLIMVGAAKKKEHARTALVKMLDECCLEDISMVDAIILTTLYADGIPGVLQPSTAKLIHVLEAVHKKFTDKETLKKFLAETKLEKSVQTHKHYAAHYFLIACKLAGELSEKELELIIQELEKLEATFRKRKPNLIRSLGVLHHGINFTLRSGLSQKELEHSVQRLANLEAEFWKSNSALIRSVGPVTRSINFVQIKRDDMDHVAFFAQCLLERLQDNHADFAKETASFLERISKLLEARIVDSDPPSFFEGGKHIARLKQLMKLFAVDTKNIPKSLERPLKQASGLLHLLADADFMNPSFLEGVKLLHSLVPQSDKDQHLLLNFFLLNRPIADAVKDKRKKLATYLGLALTGLYGRGYKRCAVHAKGPCPVCARTKSNRV